MKKIVSYLKDFLSGIDKRIFFLSTLFIAFGIFFNYHFKIEKAIVRLPFPEKYVAWFSIFFTAFSFPYLLSFLFKKKIITDSKFFILLFIAPALFAWKLSGNIHFDFIADEQQNKYWNQVVYWPLKLLTITVCLWLIWKLFEKDQSLYGLSTKNFEAKPYVIMLLIMVPLIAAASTQKDFLAMYPKIKNVQFFLDQKNTGLYKLLYELSYGTDFFTIELFFRGFLILAFAKWAGKDSVLPMALFYCTIHFGKPLGECISSYFGGIILGVITFHTGSIFGGLMVHLGIAWLMELGGYLGATYFNMS
jgi:hypothetical protein